IGGGPVESGGGQLAGGQLQAAGGADAGQAQQQVGVGELLQLLVDRADGANRGQALLRVVAVQGQVLGYQLRQQGVCIGRQGLLGRLLDLWGEASAWQRNSCEARVLALTAGVPHYEFGAVGWYQAQDDW